MSQDNIEAFEDMAQKILDHLLLAFPHTVDLSPKALGIEQAKEGDWEEGRWISGNPRSDEEKLFHSSLHWLYASGFVFARTTDKGELISILLTEKGLATLRRTPNLAPVMNF